MVGSGRADNVIGCFQYGNVQPIVLLSSHSLDILEDGCWLIDSLIFFFVLRKKGEMQTMLSEVVKCHIQIISSTFNMKIQFEMYDSIF